MSVVTLTESVGALQKTYWNGTSTVSEPVHPGEELLAFVDMDLSFLSTFVEPTYWAGQSLFDHWSELTTDGFLSFRDRIMQLIAEISRRSIFLGALAESYFDEYDAFYENDPLADEPSTSQTREFVACAMNLPSNILRTHFMICTGLEDCQQNSRIGLNPWLLPILTTHAALCLQLQDGVCERFCVFGGVQRYYAFLFHAFYVSHQSLLRCARCGKLFLQVGNRPAKYCTRTDAAGRTCRELGPVERHKKIAREDSVIEAFDRAKRRMYKRMERSSDLLKPSPSSLSLDDYYAWLSSAEAVRADYLNGRLSAEAALQHLNS